MLRMIARPREMIVQIIMFLSDVLWEKISLTGWRWLFFTKNKEDDDEHISIYL